MATPALTTGYKAKDATRAKPFAIVNRLLVYGSLLVFVLVLSGFSHAQDFTIVVLPDPQNATQSFPQVLNSQMQWVVDNRQALNIQMVLNEGDTVNDGAATAQWQNADAAYRLLDNAGIPYLLALGNHDYNGFTPKLSRDLTGFNQWFGPTRFYGKEFYKGSFPPGSNANSYGVLTINGKPYLFMALEYRPTAAALDWAETILAANPDKEAILAVHSYLLSNGYREDLCDSQDMPAGNANGQEVWARLRKYANVIMVVGGHFTGGTGARRADLGDKNNLVNQMFANYQDPLNGGDGWLRIITFHPLTNTISVQTYSPFRNQFRTDSANQFTLAYHNPLPNTAMGAIAGRVRNQAGCAAVPGITVRAGTVSTTTAADGTYRLQVTPGNYSVTTSGTGWNASTNVDRVTDSLETQMNFYLTASTPPPPCTLNPGSPSVTVCTPSNNAVVSSPVRVVAASRDSVAVSFMQIYVDGKAVLTKNGGSLDTSVPMAAGVRRLTVQAQNVAGVTFKQTIYITVTGTSSACTAGPVSPSVTICAPANNAVMSSPVRVLAASRDSVTVSFMQIYVDGKAVLTKSGGSLDASVPMAAGVRRLTVQAKDVAGRIFKQTINITVR